MLQMIVSVSNKCCNRSCGGRYKDLKRAYETTDMLVRTQVVILEMVEINLSIFPMDVVFYIQNLTSVITRFPF